jgi:hypothetical protein
MKAKRVPRVLWWLGFAAALALLWPLTFIVLEATYGGPHSTYTGESYGFRIGMTKREVLETYKALEREVNLRTLTTNDHSRVCFLVIDRSELVYSAEWEGSDHWMGYRHKFPLYYQEFHFTGGVLTCILNYIRFYET